MSCQLLKPDQDQNNCDVTWTNNENTSNTIIHTFLALVSALALANYRLLCWLVVILERRISSATLFIVGFLLCVTSMISTSYISSLTLLFITHSLLYGFGSTLMLNSPLTVIESYFPKHHPRHVLTTSIMNLGAPVGQYIRIFKKYLIKRTYMKGNPCHASLKWSYLQVYLLQATMISERGTIIWQYGWEDYHLIGQGHHPTVVVWGTSYSNERELPSSKNGDGYFAHSCVQQLKIQIIIFLFSNTQVLPPCKWANCMLSKNMS